MATGEEFSAPGLRIVPEHEVERLLTPDLLLTTVEATLIGMAAGRVIVGGKAMINLDDADGRRTLLAMTGVLLDQKIAGVKWVGTFARNPERGLARAPATILLSDAVTGTPLAVVAATALTSRRTAAMATVAAKFCADPAASCAAILGFGAVGKAAIPLLAKMFPIQRFCVWGGNPDRVRREAAELAATGIPIVAAPDVASAAADADIIITASGLTADAPFLARAMVRDGAFVCALGSYQEIETDVVTSADMLVVDDFAAGAKRGNLAPAVKAGMIGRASIHGELAEVVGGGVAPRRPGCRLSVACFLGLGALDVALAARIIRHGSRVPL
jgi:ornithine cyclodeaminase